MFFNKFLSRKQSKNNKTSLNKDINLANEQASDIVIKDDAEYTEIETSIEDLRDDDLVQGADGKWYPIKILDIQNKQLYNVITNKGTVQCSFDHEWTLYVKLDDGYNEFGKQYTTQELYDNITKYKYSKIGLIDGAELLDVTEADINKCRCIQVETPDHQFYVLTDKGVPILTHNCAGRMCCGRLNATASLMCLGSSLGTNVDGNRKGAGLYSVNGEITNIQYYFADTKWIEKWFKDRGFDKNGKVPGEDIEHEIKLEGEEEFSIRDNDQLYEFEDVNKEVINKHEQKFENI